MTERSTFARSELFRRWPWLETAAFIVPLMAHMLVQSLVQQFLGSDDSSAKAWNYSITIAAQIAVAMMVFVFFFPTWRRHFPLKVSFLAFVVGVAGYGLWVFICSFEPERSLLAIVGLQDYWPSRKAFDPFTEISNDSFRTVFLAMRFTTLALIVPVAEELFLRGFLVRWIEDVDLKSVQFDRLGWAAIAAPTICSVLTHPETIAAIVWFSLVTWLMIQTRNFWNCVVAHMVTNLLLGVHVIATGRWELW